MDSDLSQIAGLSFVSRWRMRNDSEGESFVVPFAQQRPFNIVFHGESHFDYGHYGIHLGQEDNLTFLGKPEQKITGRFYDARKGSTTEGVRVTQTFAPTSERTLQIPPGVAHSFEGLEKVTTLNSYQLYLPSPSQWQEQLKFWNPKADIINVTDKMIDEELPLFTPNTEPVSPIYYRSIDEKISQTKFGSKHYPEVVRLENGAWLRLYERDNRKTEAQLKPLVPISGVSWERKDYVRSGKEAGIVPRRGDKSFYIVDHGFTYYENDTFGVHLCQEDRLTFLGPKDQAFHIEMVDLRETSKDWGKKTVLEITPSPIDELRIPPGVAHRLIGMQNIFTINQPKYFFDSAEMLPGLDVLDWAEWREKPRLRPHSTPANPRFYELQVKKQRELMERGSAIKSPSGYLTRNDAGRPVKAIFRKRAR